MARKNLTWNGKAVSARMKAAQIDGVNRTMAVATALAKRKHGWQNRTGILEGGVNLIDLAAETGTGVKGVWGVQDIKYALIHELGGVIRPVKAKALAIPQADGSVRMGDAQKLAVIEVFTMLLLARKARLAGGTMVRQLAGQAFADLLSKVPQAAEAAAATEGATGAATGEKSSADASGSTAAIHGAG